MRLILVRHGETEWNRLGREMGQLDSNLTARGRQQALALARRLTRLSIGALYTSDLGRALDTAKCISQACNVAIGIDAGLPERHMGVLQGLTLDEMRAKYPEVVAGHDTRGFYDDIPGGESAVDRRDRSARTLSEIAQRHPNGTVVAVTHSGLLMGFLEFVLGLPPGSGRRFRKDHASFNSFEFGPSGWRLETWNDLEHLNDIAPV